MLNLQSNRISPLVVYPVCPTTNATPLIAVMLRLPHTTPRTTYSVLDFDECLNMAAKSAPRVLVRRIEIDSIREGEVEVAVATGVTSASRPPIEGEPLGHSQETA